MASAALRLGPVLIERPLVEVVSRWPDRVAGLVGARVLRLRCRGKHLLLELSDSTSLRVHLRMTGSWRVEPPRTAPARWGDLGEVSVGFRSEAGVAVCRRAPDLDRVPTRAVHLHPALQRVGPDLIGLDVEAGGPLPLPPPPVDQAVANARQHGAGRSLHAVLLDQSIAAGLGNVYANELAFVLRRHPLTPVDAIGDDALMRAYERGASWLRRNVGPGPRTTVRDGPAGSLWVTRRHRRPCRRCGTRIARGRSAPPHDRPLWWCPRCQLPPGGLV